MARGRRSAGERRGRDALLRAADVVATTTAARVALQRLAALVDPDVLPEDVRAAVAGRLAAAGVPEPLAAREVRRRLSAAWRRPPARVLDDFDDAPLSVTPVAQAHAASVDGDPVVVKVRRPGVAEAVRRDVALLEPAFAALAPLAPRADLGAVAREFRERLLDELDFEHAASAQRAVHRALRRHTELVVAAPLTALCHDDVLVAGRIDGTPLRAVAGEADAGRRRRAAVLAVRFFLGLAALGWAHAEPDPDDALLLDDGRLAVVGLRSLAPVPRGRAALAADLLEALAAGDGAVAGAGAQALGWLPGDAGDELLALARTVLGGLLAPSARLDAPALRDAAGRARPAARDVLALGTRTTPVAADLWPLRGAGTLALLLARLDVEADWVALACHALRHGP